MAKKHQRATKRRKPPSRPRREAPPTASRRSTTLWKVGLLLGFVSAVVFVWQRPTWLRKSLRPERRPSSRSSLDRRNDAERVVEAPTQINDLPVSDTTASLDSTAGMTDEELDIALRKEQIDEARRLATRYPKDQNASYLLGLVHQEQGDADSALAAWQTCLKLNISRADLLQSMGEALVTKGDLESAATMFQKSLAIEPGRLSARVKLAETLRQLGKLQQVTSTLTGDLGDNAQAYLLLGQAYQQLNDPTRAKDAFLAAANQQPELADAHYGLGQVYSLLQDPIKAKEHLEKFQDIKQQEQVSGRVSRTEYDPLEITRRSVAHTHTDVGRVYQRLRQLDESARLWKRAATIDGSSVECREMLAELYRRMQRPQDAVSVYDQLKRLEPHNALHFFNAGNMHVILKQFAAAERDYRQVIELEPDRADGYRALAQLLVIANARLPEAIALARRAIELEPNAATYKILSDANERHGDLPAALEAIRQAIQIDPNNLLYRRRHDALRNRSISES